MKAILRYICYGTLAMGCIASLLTLGKLIIGFLKQELIMCLWGIVFTLVILLIVGALGFLIASLIEIALGEKDSKTYKYFEKFWDKL